jgi:uncharacterized protein (UPF0335 family)
MDSHDNMNRILRKIKRMKDNNPELYEIVQHISSKYAKQAGFDPVILKHLIKENFAADLADELEKAGITDLY